MRIIIVVLFISFGYGIYSQSLNLNDFITNSSYQGNIPTCLSNTTSNLELLKNLKIPIKSQNNQWIYFTIDAEKFRSMVRDKILVNPYFEFSPPHVLSDTAIRRHKINLIHQGVGIDTNYTGKGVVLGIVDQGIDFNHPDFKLANGKTRVLRYWDHTVSGSTNSPYGYGIVWDSSAINNGICTSLETGTSHGTTVSGIASGNARANEKHKGAAPESDVIVVETNFNFPNWSLTIADACDYIFKVADSLDKPAVINLSLGSYLGSHDARDAAALLINNLLEEEGGRIIVCAAGNSGGVGKYHVRHENTIDTSFVWSVNNPGNTYVGNNKILFDLWGDTTLSNYQFAYGADRPGPNYGFVGRTNFRTALSDTNGVVVYDTIYNAQGQRIACIETWREIVGENFHMQAVFRTIDSLNYLYRFETFGSGSYDIWAGAWQRCSDFVTQIPSDTVMSEIVNYIMPDSLQSIVSSWACSDKVVTVGNLQNLTSYFDKNGNTQVINTPVIKGELAVSSSKGPTRLGILKPDVSASGDVSFGSSPLAYLNNSANNSFIDPGGFHSKNGGTSMASPVVAGTAALYLQKCSLASYQDFLLDISNSSMADSLTGILPNFAYGHGKLNAQELLLQKHRPVNVNGPNGICVGTIATLSFSSQMNPTSISWSNNATSPTITTPTPGNYSVSLRDELGCISRSPDKILLSFSLPFVDAGPNLIVCPEDTIVLNGLGTAQNYSWNNNVQNNTPFIPDLSGFYVVNGTDINGCTSKDSAFIDFYTLMPVNYDELVNTVDIGDLAFNVSEGIPSGGTYSGPGIIGTTFHPGLAGVGSHAIVYSVLNNNGCYSRDTAFIEVTDINFLNTLSNGLNVYPNPTDKSLQVYTDNYFQYLLLSQEGKLIQEGTCEIGHNLLDLKDVKAGLYVIKFFNHSMVLDVKISKIAEE